MKKNYPGLSYQDLAAKLTANNFDADKYANIVENSGAK